MAGDTRVSAGWIVVVGAVALVVGGTAGAVTVGSLAPPTGDDRPSEDGSSALPGGSPAVATFDSRTAFRRYLGRTAPGDRTLRATGMAGARGDEVAADGERIERAEPGRATATPVAAATPISAGGASTPRVSTTNVQVTGIDEPDRLKVARDALFYSRESNRYVTEPHEADTHPGDRRAQTYLLNASDPAAPAVVATVDAGGRLLLVGDTLVVFEPDRLVGYDVSDRSEPTRDWTRSLSGRVVTARLYQGHVYLVTAQGIDRDRPCPVEPVAGGEVACSGIHHPERPVAVDRTYVVTVMDPETGEVEDTTGFVGTADQSAVYMSGNAVYLTYTERASRADLMIEFLLQNQSDRLDERTRRHLQELRRYNLSDRAKRYEVMATFRRWARRQEDATEGGGSEDIGADLRAWMADHKREVQQTGIVEFAVEDPGSSSPSVAVDDVGAVPGEPLDQFALSEHEGHLRIATTIDGAFGTESANDVYVLDDSLSVVGSVQGMGLTERIYSVRFRGEEAYVVTFRRVDPFHVLDLSNPDDPTLEGTLKLPGYSSYLHPLGQDRVLGIGEEDDRVKLVVFDVSNPRDPTILDSRVLDARWSGVARTHHAFLRDPRHGVFFLPTADAGLVYSTGDGLERVASVQVEGTARRAAYIGDYLYVFGEASMTVVDETTWNRTATVALGSQAA